MSNENINENTNEIINTTSNKAVNTSINELEDQLNNESKKYFDRYEVKYINDQFFNLDVTNVRCYSFKNILTILTNELRNIYDEELLNIDEYFSAEGFKPIININNKNFKIEFKCNKSNFNLELSNGTIINQEDELKNTFHNKQLSGSILFQFSRVIKDESYENSKFCFVLLPVYVKIDKLVCYDKFESIKNKIKA